MMHQDLILPFFELDGKLPAKTVKAIMGIVSEGHLKKGEYFIKAGAVKDKLALVTKGCLRYYYLKDGEEITGEFWQEGEMAGSFDSSILQQPSRLFIEAIEDTSFLKLSYSDIKGLTEKFPILNQVIIRLLEKFIVESQLRIASYIMETPEERYLRLREEMPRIEDRVHQKYIASFVGVTPVTLSRIRARLANRLG